MIRIIKHWIERYTEKNQRPLVHCECRRCGKTLANDETSCPNCGSGDVAVVSL